MGSKGRRRKSKAASVSGGHPEENTGSYPGKELDPAAAAPATGSLPEKDLDPPPAAAAAAVSHPEKDLDPAAPAVSHPEKNLVPDDLPSRYPLSYAYWKSRGRPVLSRSRQAEIDEENCRLLNTFKDKLKVLDNKLLEKEHTRDAIKNQIDQLESDTSEPRDADHIIAFVKEIQRQIELIEIKDYLKQRVDIIQPDSNDFDILKVLIQKERVHKHYENLEFRDIVNAINVCIVDLRIKRGHKEDIHLSLSRAASLKNNDGKSSNPFRDLVKAVRQKDYIMDEDPLKELNIIKNHHPTIYYENEVQVRGVPLDYDEEQVKAAFSVCGEIVDVEVNRGGAWSNIAYVTFKESEGAKIAPFLVEPPFSVLPIREVRKLATDSELREALKRYNNFRIGKTGRSAQLRALAVLRF